jgi:beta-lactamase regulating signal transducer with metallopeptidase domain
MTTLDAFTTILAGGMVDRLAWTLLHFVWQGGLIGAAAWIAIGALASPRARYAAGVAALAVMTGAALATFATAGAQGPGGRTLAPAAAYVPGAADDVEPAAASAGVPAAAGRSRTSAVVVVLWFAGVAALSLRLAGGWMMVCRLRRQPHASVDEAIAAAARRIGERLGLARTVSVVRSSTVAAPVLIGWLKPVVLLPAAALAGLSPAQLEALIAHELAHVKRHDYLVNLLQSAVETLLFYHPAVWWVSREVRRQREYCCDDLAVAVSDRVVYASALTELAALAPHARLALGAADGPLLERIRRILEGHASARAESGWAAMPLIAVIVVLLTAAAALMREPAAAQSTTATPVAARPVRGEPLPAPARSVTRAAAPARVPNAAPREQFTVTTSETVPASARAHELQLGLRRLEIEIERLVNQQYELDAAREEAEHAARRDEAERKVQALRRSLEQMGMARADQGEAADLREMLLQAERDLRKIRDDAQFQQKVAELAAVQRQRQRELERLVQELAALEQARIQERIEHSGIPEQDQRRAEAEAALMARLHDQGQRDAEALAKLAAEWRASLAQRSTRFHTVTMQGTPDLTYRIGTSGERVLIDPRPAPVGTRAEPLDVAVIVIEGETELPREYRVAGDGSIDLPLLGSVAVQGLTASEIAQRVTKELAERRLAVDRRVTATLHRR